MRYLMTFACAMIVSGVPVTAEEVQRTVVILLDPATGSVSQVVAAPISGSSTELLDLLLARLVDAEKRADEADPENLRERLAAANNQARQDRESMELLMRQAAALRGQVGGLQDLLGDVRRREDALIDEVEALSVELEAARARIAGEAQPAD